MLASGPLTPEETAVYEANAVALGVGLDVLMEHAGRAVAEEAVAHLTGTPGRIVLLVGPGNNGGDGSTAAYYLQQWGHPVELWMVAGGGGPRTALARRAFDRVRRSVELRDGVPTSAELAGATLVIDAMLGVGHRAPLRSPYREACTVLAGASVPILAVDVPTGYSDPAGIRARWTVTFTGPKANLPEDRLGTVVVRDVGVPSEAWERTGPGEFQRLRSARPLGPSGRGGRVVVVGGGPYAGAPALTALAALRCGAERATAIVPGAAAALVQGFAKDLVVRGVGGSHFTPEDADPVLRMISAGPVAAVVAGPGAGDDPATRAFFAALLPALDPSLPVLVDADALPALRNDDGSSRLFGRAVVATPNPGEFRKLRNGPDPVDLASAVQTLALNLGVCVVRKGSEDLISEGRATVRNLHHPPAMAVAGAGDVLDGVIGALLARGIDPVGAARLGTFWAGEAGRIVAAVRGDGLIASDLVEALPEARRRRTEGPDGPGPA
jgi:hydroxyethylthiazole kinase-like uncharacterized protein yjeF